MTIRLSTHGVVRAMALSIALAAITASGGRAESTGTMECTLRCEHGEDAGCASPLEHVAWNSVPLNGGGATHPECIQATCAANHSCPPAPGANELDLTEAVNAAVDAGDVSKLEALVEASGNLVKINSRRMAFQVLNCSGAVVAHLPAPTEIISAVQSATASR